MENQKSLNSNPAPSPVIPDSVPGSISTNPIKPIRKFSIKAIIGTIIFLLLAGGAAAGYVYRDPIIKLVSNPTPTPTVSLSPTPTPDPTADWKTYEGEGFMFKYPASVFSLETPAKSPIVLKPMDAINETDGISINARINKLTELNMIMESYKNQIVVTNETEIENGTKIIGKRNGPPGSGVPDPVVSAMLNANYKYIHIFATDKTSIQYIDLILTTFKFAKAIPIDTSHWKTYSGDGFSFKYPATEDYEFDEPITGIYVLRKQADSITIDTRIDNNDEFNAQLEIAKSQLFKPLVTKLKHGIKLSGDYKQNEKLGKSGGEAFGSISSYIAFLSSEDTFVKMETTSRDSYQDFDGILTTFNISGKKKNTSSTTFKKRYFDVEGGIGAYNKTYKYDKGITSIALKDLNEISCTPLYSRDNNGNLSIPQTDIVLRDSGFVNALNEIDNLTSENIGSALYCKSRNNIEIIQYGIHSGGAGTDTKIYLATKMNGSTIEKVAEIKNTHHLPYFDCKPFQLTLSGDYFLSCSGADGGNGGESIYKINLLSKSISVAMECIGSQGSTIGINCK